MVHLLEYEEVNELFGIVDKVKQGAINLGGKFAAKRIAGAPARQIKQQNQQNKVNTQVALDRERKTFKQNI